MSDTPRQKTETAEKFRSHVIAEMADVAWIEMCLRMKPDIRLKAEAAIKKSIAERETNQSQCDAKMEFLLELLDEWEELEALNSLKKTR